MTTDTRPLTERLRSGFGGLVPPVCDEAANRIDELTAELDTLVAEAEKEGIDAFLKCGGSVKWGKKRHQEGYNEGVEAAVTFLKEYTERDFGYEIGAILALRRVDKAPGKG